MGEEDKKLLDDFLASTKIWHKEFSYPDEACQLCGTIPDNQLKLSRIVEELREKAWKYDQLSK